MHMSEVNIFWKENDLGAMTRICGEKDPKTQRSNALLRVY